MLPSTSKLNDYSPQRDDQQQNTSDKQTTQKQLLIKDSDQLSSTTSEDPANIPSTSKTQFMQKLHGGDTNEYTPMQASPPTKRKDRVEPLESYHATTYKPRAIHARSSGGPVGDRPSSVSTYPSNLDAFDIIEESSNISTDSLNMLHLNPLLLDFDDVPVSQQIEPIVIRGNGYLTLFGLSNSFSREFPQSLIGRVSREEFEQTLDSVNSLLRQQQSLNAKLILAGCLCCCCSFGCSLLWPSVALRKRTKASLEKLLANENNRLYKKLGLVWKLIKQRCYSNHAFLEYVLLIEFIAKVNLYQPD